MGIYYYCYMFVLFIFELFNTKSKGRKISTFLIIVIMKQEALCDKPDS
jgi:hypothetical protein